MSTINKNNMTILDEQLNVLADIVHQNSYIDPTLYDLYNVKRGLRNANGTGVLVGITRVASVIGYEMINGVKTPTEGSLFYRGVNMTDIVDGFQREGRRGFEEVVYLLLFGILPTASELHSFIDLLESCRDLPISYKEDVILKIPSTNIMNKLQRTVLTLYSYDENPEDTSIRNVLSQSINLIAKIPLITAYAYQAKRHYFDNQSLILHTPKSGAGTAENILHMIRSDSVYTEEEVDILDLLMVIHAEHGGGNNSAFATHVVSSTGTDTYSAISTAIGSLKGPKHGGANLMVAAMIEDIKSHINDWSDEVELKNYLTLILEKKAFDKKGLIYGMGHAVYTLSDPRAIVLKKKAEELAILKGLKRNFQLISDIERIVGKMLNERLGSNNAIAANVDLYSGFVFEMLGIPQELYTPIFAASRMAGWCAHRLEQILDEKIMRPAYVTLGDPVNYSPIDKR